MFQKTLCAVTFLCCCFAPAIAKDLRAQEYPVKPMDEHARLKANVGVWDAEIRIFQDGPEGEPSISSGVETVAMLGELWNIFDLVYDYQGQQVRGHGLFGYDPSRKKYVGTWHESGSPYPSTLEGTYDATNRKITYSMQSRDPAGKPRESTVVMQQIDPQNRRFEMYVKSPDGGLAKIMDMNYRKRRSTAETSATDE